MTFEKKRVELPPATYSPWLIWTLGRKLVPVTVRVPAPLLTSVVVFPPFSLSVELIVADWLVTILKAVAPDVIQPFWIV